MLKLELWNDEDATNENGNSLDKSDSNATRNSLDKFSIVSSRNKEKSLTNSFKSVLKTIQTITIIIKRFFKANKAKRN